MLPINSGFIVSQPLQVDLPTKTYKIDPKTNDFVLENGKLVEVDGIEGIKSWVWNALMTQKDAFDVYKIDNIEKSFGIDHELFFKNAYPLSFIKQELTRQIKEILFRHPKIQTISNIDVSKDLKKLTYSFECITTDGQNFTQEVVL